MRAVHVKSPDVHDAAAAAAEPEMKKVIVIGAGISGTSVAYHLALRGWKDILVVDQGPLFENVGATSHAPGGISAGDARSPTVTWIARYSSSLYTQLGAMSDKGSIHLARTQLGLNTLRSELNRAEWLGISRARLVTPEEIHKLFPSIDPTAIAGGLYYSDDLKPAPGRANPVQAVEKMAKLSTEMGSVVFKANTKVSKIVTNDQREITGVMTEDGQFLQSEHVILAAGIWGSLLARTIGVELPLANVQHQFVLTSPLPSLMKYSWPGSIHGSAYQNFPTSLPGLWDPENRTYMYTFGANLGIGSYNHKAMVVHSEDVKMGEHPALFKFTEEHFKNPRSNLEVLIPDLKSAHLLKSFNGLMTYAPDGYPVIGPITKVKGFWVMECCYIWHAGGAGKILADWMVDGKLTDKLPINEIDVGRFGDCEERMDKAKLEKAVADIYESRMSDHRKAQL